MYNEQTIWKILQTIPDPEIPVLSILDLGIVRNVICKNDDNIEVIITPTYVSCPAIDVIAMQIRMSLLQLGIKNIQITTQLSPAWTTDWITEAGKQKLKEFGIVPPQPKKEILEGEEIIACPKCNSTNTCLISQFGSTACKALYQCNDCKEPFDYFKCH